MIMPPGRRAAGARPDGHGRAVMMLAIHVSGRG